MRLIPCAPARPAGWFVHLSIMTGLLGMPWSTSVLANRIGPRTPNDPTAPPTERAPVDGPRLLALSLLDPPLESETPRPAPALYAKFCAKCHKADGAGSKRRASDLPDFTRAAWQRDVSDVQLRVSIRDGKGNAMPSFADRLSEREMIDLVAHVREFAPARRTDGPEEGRADFDVRFRILERELEELRREFWKLHAASKQNKPEGTPMKTSDR
jgi:mono/diheme cytochrome c family protein